MRTVDQIYFLKLLTRALLFYTLPTEVVLRVLKILRPCAPRVSTYGKRHSLADSRDCWSSGCCRRTLRRTDPACPGGLEPTKEEARTGPGCIAVAYSPTSSASKANKIYRYCEFRSPFQNLLWHHGEWYCDTRLDDTIQNRLTQAPDFA